ncbi:MAG: hypothetical protein MN733_10585 [Nitrososphaera sp.]|nr:hypothetical protein [Nitrososphaera sp.]
MKRLLNKATEFSLLLGLLFMIAFALFIVFVSNKPTQASPALSGLNAYPPPEEGAATPTLPAYPGPESTSSPTPTPIFSSLTPTETEVVSVLTLNGEGLLPEYEQVYSSSEDMDGLTVAPMVLTYEGHLPSESPTTLPEEELGSGGPPLVDNWNRLLWENFDSDFPSQGCVVEDQSNDGYERYWAPDDGRALRHFAGWPAKGGADGVSPDLGVYPSNLSSWLVCGPFDLSDADKFVMEYSFWLETDILGDGFLSAVSLDGQNFQAVSFSGISYSWTKRRDHIIGAAGDSSVWVAWIFISDEEGNIGEGVWLENISVWEYYPPQVVCGNFDPGSKGVVLDALDPSAPAPGAPMIRAGDTIAVDRLMIADVNWVRLVFLNQSRVIDLMDYDRMIDTLCANDISVLGVVNHQTLFRQDYNDPATAAEYRQEFAGWAEFLSEYYAGRVKYWEVWNEPNFVLGPYVDPELYAPLLNDTYLAIKEDNPNAQVLFGGLASAWDDSHDYLVQVYEQFNTVLGGVRPFDRFAIHPYPRPQEGPNPGIYMYSVDNPAHVTILDKFLERMYLNNDGNKKLWITEVGWNSSKDLPNRPECHDPVLVYESEQAAYLTPMFDILFNEVTLWNNPNTLAVEKVFWYQYMDVRISPDPCATPEANTSGHIYVPFGNMLVGTSGDKLWLYGLYRSDKVTPKPVMCAFLAYPLTCDEYLQPSGYLPTIQQNP